MLKKKIGFIGFGRVVEWQIKMINSLNYEIIFICDLSKDKIAKASNLIKGVKTYSNLDQLLHDETINQTDFVVVATPSGNHFDVVKRLENKNNWQIIVEKPTFLNPSNFLEAKKFKNKIIPIFQNRYNKSVVKAKEILSKNLIGDIHYASLTLDWFRPQRYYNLADWRGSWLNDGGVSTNQGIHYFDITNHLLGGFKNVFARMRRIAVDIQCEDYLVAFFELNSGLNLDVRMTTALRHPEEEAALVINGSKGTLKLHGVCCNKLLLTMGDGDKEIILGKGEKKEWGEEVEMPYGYGHKTMFKILLGEEENKDLKLPDLEESFKTMQFIFSCYESAITGNISQPKFNYDKVPLGSINYKKIEFAE